MKQLLPGKRVVMPSGSPVAPVATCRAALARMDSRVCRNAGFTLLELMIVVSIIAILSAIAYPSYVSYITKSHRVAAEGCLSEYANYMERYYTTNLSYKTAAAGDGSANSLPVLDCAGTQQTGNNYSYDLPASALSVSSYSVTATPLNAQLSRDTNCGTLSLNQTGTRNVTGPGGVSMCW